MSLYSSVSSLNENVRRQLYPIPEQSETLPYETSTTDQKDSRKVLDQARPA